MRRSLLFTGGGYTLRPSIGRAPHFEPTEIAKASLELDNQPKTEWQHGLVY
jgi:hypothetical protein